MITLLRAEIKLEPGWAVGAVPIGDPTIDRDLLIDQDGRPWVPGSSLAGSIRAHLRASDAAAGTDYEVRLMGSRPPTGRGEETTASPLWLLGTRFVVDDGDLRTPAVTEVVGQTAIDRVRRSAAEGSLRHSRTVASGGTLTAYFRFDGTLAADDLAVLAAWQPVIGRDRTSGGGRATLVGIHHGTVNPALGRDMAVWLTHTGAELVDAVAVSHIPGSNGPVVPWLSAGFLVRDAILVGDPRPTGPATPRLRNGRPFVPGAAWKGIIRSRVEYIVRSLYGVGAVCTTATGCGDCPTCEVFGHQHRQGRLRFVDSMIEAVSADDAPPTPEKRTQVAIDRVTGGSRDAQLFETTPITAGRLTLRIDELRPVPAWARTAVLHVLRDIDDGLLGVGSRVTRGMGTLQLESPIDDPGPVVVPALAARSPEEVA
jgi:CRISPR/Cas system CSM-associated protein Csm3 (group 7 of RAMP superfamily)